MTIETRLKLKLSHVAEAIADYARPRKLSQRDLAKILGKEVGYVNMVLKGNANLTLRTISEFEERLGITLLESARRRWIPEKQKGEEKTEEFNYNYAMAA